MTKRPNHPSAMDTTDFQVGDRGYFRRAAHWRWTNVPFVVVWAGTNPWTDRTGILALPTDRAKDGIIYSGPWFINPVNDPDYKLVKTGSGEIPDHIRFEPVSVIPGRAHPWNEFVRADGSADFFLDEELIAKFKAERVEAEADRKA